MSGFNRNARRNDFVPSTAGQEEKEFLNDDGPSRQEEQRQRRDESGDDDDDDMIAEQLAQQARDESVAMVTNHLYTHLDQNPNSSFVTWVATLHPENAHITIDPRFEHPNNPWRIVYDEVTQDLSRNNGRTQRHRPTPPSIPLTAPSSRTATFSDYEDCQQQFHHFDHPVDPSAPSMMKYADSAIGVESEKLPTASVIHSVGARPQHPSPSCHYVILPAAEDELGTTKRGTSQQQQQQQHPAHGSLIDILIGGTLVIFSASFTLLMELLSTYMYLSCCVCCKLSKACSNPTVRCCTVLPFVICWLLCHIFQLCELLMFALSIIVVELLAFMGWLLCSIFSLSCHVGQTSHQRIRKVAHITRWAFRQPFQSWTEPPRAAGIDLLVGLTGSDSGSDSSKANNNSS